MNTHSHIKIICYGDSNTWGYIPVSGERYAPTIRWTGILQNALGNSFEIIEEGLNSRTTTVDDPLYAGKNGKTYLLPCIETHAPFDIILLFLGTNDLKERFERSAEQIGDSMQELVTIIKNHNRNTKIILVCPSMVDETVSTTQKNYKGAQIKSLQLPAIYQQIAQKYELAFVNVQELVKPSKKDGFHFDPEDHAVLARAFERVIRTII